MLVGKYSSLTAGQRLFPSFKNYFKFVDQHFHLLPSIILCS